MIIFCHGLGTQATCKSRGVNSEVLVYPKINSYIGAKSEDDLRRCEGDEGGGWG